MRIVLNIILYVVTGGLAFTLMISTVAVPVYLFHARWQDVVIVYLMLLAAGVVGRVIWGLIRNEDF